MFKALSTEYTDIAVPGNTWHQVYNEQKQFLTKTNTQRSSTNRLLVKPSTRSRRKINPTPQMLRTQHHPKPHQLQHHVPNIWWKSSTEALSPTSLSRRCNDAHAPVLAVITLRKIRSPLKTKVPDEITSRVVYKITCPACHACYVGQTERHTRTRFGEHKTERSGPVRKHFEVCAKRKAELTDMTILPHKTTRSIVFLETLEALYIRELKPTLNTRDEWMSRELTILVWCIFFLIM